MFHTSFVRMAAGQLLVCAQGEMTLGRGILKMRQALEAVIGEYDRVLVDISEVTAMDPAAAEMLVLARATGQAHGTTIKLRGLSMAHLELMVLVKLLSIFGPAELDCLHAA